VLSISGSKVLAIALLLVLSTTMADAQNVSPTQIPETTGSLPGQRESVAKEAIRVPAFGTTQPATMTLAAHKPRKRIVVRRIQARDMAPPADWRPLHYRFGYAYGPGIRLYRW
jgi:hypothetical protein